MPEMAGKQTCLLAAVFFLTALFAVSCSSVRSMAIETYNPASITFPSGIGTVMLVNNSAQQPDAAGHRFMRNGKDETDAPVPADSMAYEFCLRLGEQIAASPVFYDVRLCRDTLRTDSAFYEKRPFSADRVRALCDDYGVDALISLDKFVFLTEMREERSNPYTFESSVRVNLSGELRVLWPGQKEVYAIPFADSLEWFWPEDFYYNPYVDTVTDFAVQYAMRHLSGIAGERIHVNFVPYWSYDNRWCYTSISSDWKRGSVYAAADKWSEAGAIWEAILSKTGKWKPKARLLSNLALCHEIGGDFEKAIACAEQSCRLFEEYAGEDDVYTKLQKWYLKILKKRAEDDKALSEQLRESS